MQSLIEAVSAFFCSPAYFAGAGTFIGAWLADDVAGMSVPAAAHVILHAIKGTSDAAFEGSTKAVDART